MSVQFANNAHSTLASGINDSATSITVASGHGARFPSLSGSQFFFATLIDTSNNLEIVKCTARSTDVLTVTRAQESTSARAFSSGDRIELRVTAAGLAAVKSIDDDAVTLAKMASGTDGNIISYDTSGNPVAVATGSSGQVLTSAGAGAVPSFQDASGTDFVGFKAFASANQTISGSTDTLLAFGGEVFDVGNNFASSTFTCPANGKYFFYANANISGMGSTTAQLQFNHAVAGGSTFSGSVIRNGPMDTSGRDGTIGTLAAIFDMTQNSTVTVRIFIFAGKTVEGNSTGETSKTTFGGYKIG